MYSGIRNPAVLGLLTVLSVSHFYPPTPRIDLTSLGTSSIHRNRGISYLIWSHSLSKPAHQIQPTYIILTILGFRYDSPRLIFWYNFFGASDIFNILKSFSFPLYFSTDPLVCLLWIINLYPASLGQWQFDFLHQTRVFSLLFDWGLELLPFINWQD